MRYLRSSPPVKGVTDPVMGPHKARDSEFGVYPQFINRLEYAESTLISDHEHSQIFTVGRTFNAQ